MAQAPGSSGSIPPKVFDHAPRSNSNAVDESDAAVAAVARETLAGAPEVQTAGGASRAPVNRELTDALLEAAKRGDAKGVSALLERGADPNAVDMKGLTALMWATDRKHCKAVKILLAAGADTTAVDENGDTALIYATTLEYTELVEIFLNAGTEPNAANKDRQTALMHAAQDKHAALVKILLNAGADPTLRNVWNKTATQIVEGHADEASREIHTLLLSAEEEWSNRAAAELFATLVPAVTSPTHCI